MWWSLGKPTYTITYDKLWPWQNIAKTFPCRFNCEITRRAYIFFCLCVIMQPTFLCSCVLIWQQKITKHYVTHIAFVLLVCTFSCLGLKIGETARPLLLMRLVWQNEHQEIFIFGFGASQKLSCCFSLHTSLLGFGRWPQTDAKFLHITPHSTT